MPLQQIDEEVIYEVFMTETSIIQELIYDGIILDTQVDKI